MTLPPMIVIDQSRAPGEYRIPPDTDSGLTRASAGIGGEDSAIFGFRI